VNVLDLGANETITAAVAVPQFDENHFCMMATRDGRIKRIALSDFASVRPSGLIAINLDNGDWLGWARQTSGDDDIILVTEQGQALRFTETAVRPTGRTAAGVTAIKLGADDRVASMEVVEPGGDLLVLTALGYGKRSPLKEYPVKGRATGGVRTIDQNALAKIGSIVAARVVQQTDELSIISANGVVLRTKVSHISQTGRSTRGVLIINLQQGDCVASVARVASSDLRRTGAE
jgi:DNA gyrase subunit A